MLFGDTVFWPRFIFAPTIENLHLQGILFTRAVRKCWLRKGLGALVSQYYPRTEGSGGDGKVGRVWTDGGVFPFLCRMISKLAPAFTYLWEDRVT